MKIPKVVIVFLMVLIPVALAAGIFFFYPQPEQVFRANLTEAQKMLVTLRRAEMAYQQSPKGAQDVSAKKIGGRIVYSDGWRAMKLPEVGGNTGFDYDCLAAELFCRALESGTSGPTGNGIRIDIATGAYTCLGAYEPVTTEGFDNAKVTIGCQAS